MTTRRILVGLTIAFVAVLAVTIGQRMSTDAMAVVIGVIFGVAASVPTSLLIAAVTRRAQASGAEQSRSYGDRPLPPVIVVNPGAANASSWFSAYQQSPAVPPNLHGEPSRCFRVVGDEDIAWVYERHNGRSGMPRTETEQHHLSRWWQS